MKLESEQAYRVSIKARIGGNFDGIFLRHFCSTLHIAVSWDHRVWGRGAHAIHVTSGEIDVLRELQGFTMLNSSVSARYKVSVGSRIAACQLAKGVYEGRGNHSTQRQYKRHTSSTNQGA